MFSTWSSTLETFSIHDWWWGLVVFKLSYLCSPPCGEMPWTCSFSSEKSLFVSLVWNWFNDWGSKSSACHLLCWLCIESRNTSAVDWTWEGLWQGKYFINWPPSAVRQWSAWLQTPGQTHPFSCTSKSPRAQLGFVVYLSWGKWRPIYLNVKVLQ